MKKHSRLIALLLGVFILITAAACSARGNAETSANETADTRAPETTDIITAATTTEEPYVSVVAPPETTDAPPNPETTAEDTTEEITTSEITTSPPTASDTLRILMQKGKGEALTSVFADEESGSVLDKRSQLLLREHALAIAVYQTDDIVSKVKKDALSSGKEYDLLLLLPEYASPLMTAGALEDLSEVGIGINSESIGIRKNLTESLTLGIGTYLLACDALVSDTTSAYAIAYDGTPLSSDPATLAASGNFTVEALLGYISEIKDEAFFLKSEDSIALFSAVGGNIFVKNAKGLPLSALTEDKTFAEKYDIARNLASKNSGDENSVFLLTKLSADADSRIFLPLPKRSSDSEYVSLADASTLSLLAAPAGVVDGHRLSALISALNMSSSEYRDHVYGSLSKGSGAQGKKLIGIISDSVRLDLGILLGWGDIDDLISDGISQNKTADSILSDRITAMRNKAVETAANIIADRLGIE